MKCFPKSERRPHHLMPRVWLAAMMSAPAGTVLADDEDTWQFEATPYVWAAGLDGRVSIKNRPAGGLGVEQRFSDILEKLDFAFMGAFEARKGLWGLLVDGVYFKVSDEAGLSGRLGLSSLDGTASVTQQLYAVAAAYRLKDGEQVVDVVGGLRYNSVKWDVKIDASVPVLPPQSRRFKESEEWMDPYVGARVQQAAGDRWSLIGYADIGGFGIGSDLSWQVIGGVNYAFTPSLTGKFGYRHVQNDYDDGDFSYDMASSGVYMGLGIRW